ncbi:MAG: anthranilate phosphoribosyltransferase [Leptospira sp.]|nr:anthranilate phosphoribosyltransferase [Leptospira sp.]
MNIALILHKAVEMVSLSEEEAYQFMISVMKGEVSEIALSSFLTSMKIKKESSEELAGFALAMRDSALKPVGKFDFDFLDTCGTGGDGKNSLNISTLAAITLASMGIRIAKHGNRSVSSLSGSSDILNALGYKIDLTTYEVEELFTKKGFAFLFAPTWHPSMRFAANVRKELGFRTFFNIIGPLSNPFRAPFQIMGVYSPELLEKIPFVLKRLGLKGSIVCHSKDGFDEFSIFQPTDYVLSRGEESLHEIFDPSVLKLTGLKEDEIFCASKEDAIRLSGNVLEGKEISGTYAVALNAGAAQFLLGHSATIEEGFESCLKQIKSGKVNEFFKEVIG